MTTLDSPPVTQRLLATGGPEHAGLATTSRPRHPAGARAA